jgi:dTDP-4-amino-4,6-dideoxygalactose transaminase
MSIPYEDLSLSNQAFVHEMKSAAARVIDSGWYILGKEVELFEKEFADYLGATHCIAVASGLDALILSITSLNLPRNSEILVPANTYIATILAIVRSGHVPVMVEPCPKTFNINTSLIKEKITSRTRAMCITHLYGQPCFMDEILGICSEYNLRLVEDCAQSHGAKYRNKSTGTFGDCGAFSFYPTKNLGCLGDGGAIITEDPDLFSQIKTLRNYGSDKKYNNTLIGFNSRLDEIQAAFLRVKLKYLDNINSHKKSLACLYENNLDSNYYKFPTTSQDSENVYHIFPVFCRYRDKLREWLFSMGVQTEIHYPIPPHHQKGYAKMLDGSYPESEELHNTEISLPISYFHTPMDVKYICSLLNKFAEENP